jgi:hypothetical protein
MLFIGYEKAFGRLPQRELWGTVKKKGFPAHMVSTVRSPCVNTRIQIDKGESAVRKYKSRSKARMPYVSHYLLFLLLYRGTR